MVHYEQNTLPWILPVPVWPTVVPATQELQTSGGKLVFSYKTLCICRSMAQLTSGKSRKPRLM